MKGFNIIYLILLMALFVGCNSNGVNTPEDEADYSEQLKKYFPYQLDKQYVFKYDTLDRSNNEYKSVGDRILKVNASEIIDNKEYYSFDQIFMMSSNEKTLNNKFRITDKSILMLTDTTNFTQGIADSLLDIMTINIDEEINILQLPLNSGNPYPAVKAYVDFQTFKFNTVDIIGEYAGTDNFSLEGINEVIRADKVRYKLDINIPDFSNPFFSNTITYYAEVWFAEEYGIVKMEGCSFLLNPMVGMNINFADTNKVSRHILSKVN